jgi:hypothetical protein
MIYRQHEKQYIYRKGHVSLSGLSSAGHQEVSDNIDIFDKLEKIVEISQKYGIKKCLTAGKTHIDYVTKKLDISPIQAVLFSHFMEQGADNHIMIGEIADSIKCSKIRIIKYINECEELEKKKLIRCSRSENMTSFRIPKDVRDSLRKFNEFKPKKKDDLSIFKFFTVLERLLFDGLSRSVDQTGNAIKNIILQELENISGILIAATNLTQNMDKTFERRFLYKIEFTKPCLAARQSIWQTMMPALAKTEAAALASRFDLSGGQIENIARKSEVDTITNGNRPSMDALTRYSVNENDNSFNSTKKIGFGNG